jgi:soluble lytic murein transglycosylase-like protein
LAQAGSLGKPHRKRAQPDHAEALASSRAMTPLARLVEGERALTLAALDPAQGLDALEALLARADDLPSDARLRWAWRAAWLALWVGQEERAQVHIHKLLADPTPSSPWGAEGAWLKALPLLTRGDWEEARPWLETSARRSPGPWREEALALGATSPEARARYWLMRADLAQGHQGDARDRLDALARHHPLSLYHLLGVHTLGHALGVRPDPLRAPSWEEHPDEPLAPPDRWIAAWLKAGALPQAERAATERRLYTPPTPARVTLWSQPARLRGQSSAQLWWAWLSPSDAPDLRWAEHAPFDEPDPSALWARIREEAAPSGLDPLLILALIGQESGFRTDKCSFSGACGLMQIKPMAAKTVQTVDDPEGGEPPLDEGDNLAVGVRLLARLREKADPRPLLALAAWNAGPGAVRRWMEARPPMEGDLWLEWMPDRRTRAWIIGILNRYSLYAAWLQGGKTRDPAR